MSKCRYCKMCGWGNDGDEDFFGWCELHLDSYDIDASRDCPDYIPVTNADRIRAMSDEKLAEQLVVAVNGLQPCTLYYSIPTERTFLTEAEAVRVTLEWLQQPAEEDT